MTEEELLAFRKKRIKRLGDNWANILCQHNGVRAKKDVEYAHFIFKQFADAVIVILETVPNKTRQARFTTKPPDYGILMTLKNFQKASICAALIDYDGHGHPAAKKDAHTMAMDQNITLRPSEYKDIPLGTTHVVWFNR